MGLFDMIFGKTPQKQKQFRNDTERRMYANNTMGYRDKKDRLDYQNALLERLNNARDAYKKDKNTEKLISVYEDVLIKAKPALISDSAHVSLAELYIQHRSHDQAWGYLNRLLVDGNAPTEKIRFMQAKILKKESKHEQAIEMYVLGYIDKASKLHEMNYTFQRDMFLKDIGPSANKLKWGDKERKHLADMLDAQIKARNYDEGVILSKYRKFIDDIHAKG